MSATTPKRPWVGLVVLLGVCFAVAWAGSAATTPKIAGWYAGLSKPAWNPPNWVFGPVWSVLYGCMAVAAWLVWRQGGLAAARRPLIWFGIQLGLNGLWSWIFFAMESPGWAFVELVLLWLAIAATAAEFWKRSQVAAILLLPYLAWATFAGVLNFAIWRLNA